MADSMDLYLTKFNHKQNSDHRISEFCLCFLQKKFSIFKMIQESIRKIGKTNPWCFLDFGNLINGARQKTFSLQIFVGIDRNLLNGIVSNIEIFFTFFKIELMQRLMNLMID